MTETRTGIVKWFSAEKGFGFIAPDDGDEIFVHQNSIECEGTRQLREGQRVRFVVVQGLKGVQADRVEPIG
ncbi:cold-shock protein [Pseudoxanthomonas suwonensis]|uniref:cold-shock protein n=1 Tax=Pseudoxanthomonas suwonensis TaxID=314722 RepID=UPI0004655E22|nr:cold-shock protein [Pseudoxanthomonas suwonensis]